MAKKAKTGAGSQLQVGDGASPEVFTKLGQIVSIKKSGEKIASEKVTNQDSDVDSNGLVTEELLPTIRSGGTVDVTLNFDPKDTSQQNLFTIFDGQKHNFKIIGPNDLTASPVVPEFTWTFGAYLLDNPDLDLPIDKQRQLTLKLTIEGASDLVFG